MSLQSATATCIQNNAIRVITKLALHLLFPAPVVPSNNRIEASKTFYLYAALTGSAWIIGCQVGKDHGMSLVILLLKAGSLMSSKQVT